MWPWLLLALLPLAVNLPALTGLFRYDPLYIVSGLTPGTWTTNGLPPGYPWVDGNAGVTTQALGTLAARDWLSGVVPWWNTYSGVVCPWRAKAKIPRSFCRSSIAGAAAWVAGAAYGVDGGGWFVFVRATAAIAAGCFAGGGRCCAIRAEWNLCIRRAWPGDARGLPAADVARRGSLAGSVFDCFGARGGMVAGSRFSRDGIPEFWLCRRLGSGAAGSGAPARRVLGARFAGVGLWPASWAPAIWPFLADLPRDFLGCIEGQFRRDFYRRIFRCCCSQGFRSADGWARRPAFAGRCVGARGRILRHRFGDAGIDGRSMAGARSRVARRYRRVGHRDVPAGCRMAAGGLAFWRDALLRVTNVHLYALPGWSMGLAVLAAYAVGDWRSGQRVAWRSALAACCGLVACAVILGAPDVAVLWSRLPGYKPLLPFVTGVPLIGAAIIVTVMRGAFSPWRGAVLSCVIIGNAALLFLIPQFAGTHGRRIDVGAIRYLQDHAGLSRVWSLGRSCQIMVRCSGCPRSGIIICRFHKIGLIIQGAA